MKTYLFPILLYGVALAATAAEPEQTLSPKAEPAAAQSALSATASQEEQHIRAAQARVSASRLRSALAVDDAARRSACYKKFLVNACLDEARQEKLQTEAEIRKLELEAGQLERKLKAEERKAHVAQAGDRSQRAAETVRRKTEHEQMVQEFEASRAEKPAQPAGPEHGARLQAFESGQGAEQQREADGAKRAGEASAQIQRHRTQMLLQPAKINKVKEAERLLDSPAKAAPAPQAAPSS